MNLDVHIPFLQYPSRVHPCRAMPNSPRASSEAVGEQDGALSLLGAEKSTTHRLVTLLVSRSNDD